jgi:hypothetical protein
MRGTLWIACLNAAADTFMSHLTFTDASLGVALPELLFFPTVEWAHLVLTLLSIVSSITHA